MLIDAAAKKLLAAARPCRAVACRQCRSPAQRSAGLIPHRRDVLHKWPAAAPRAACHRGSVSVRGSSRSTSRLNGAYFLAGDAFGGVEHGIEGLTRMVGKARTLLQPVSASSHW